MAQWKDVHVGVGTQSVKEDIGGDDCQSYNCLSRDHGTIYRIAMRL